MKITGYCTECRRIRTVRVRQFHPRRHVQHGVCDACQATLDREAEERSARRHPANQRTTDRRQK